MLKHQPNQPTEIFSVTIYDENRHGDPAPDTTMFPTLIEAMNFAYLEGYREKREVLNLCTLNLETGAVEALHDKKAIYTICVNREHDEQQDELRWTLPQKRPDGSPVGSVYRSA